MNQQTATIPLSLQCQYPGCTCCKSDKKYKYCKPCSKKVKKELLAAGYLESIDFRTPHRPREAREDINETKFGFNA